MPKQGGSQLSQLKSAFHSSEIKPTSNGPSKKRKRVAPEPSHTTSKPSPFQHIAKKLNPFDVKTTKLKQNIPGQKVKGVTGRPAKSKQIGLDQRKSSLLVEYEKRGRSGGILDRRFGEKDPVMSVEDRMLGRFAHERQRTSQSAYNLEDENDIPLYGQNMDDADDFERTGLALDPEVASARSDLLRSPHHQNEDADDEPPRKKTRSEVMSEIMEKSKHHKHERQAQKETDDNIRHELDQELDGIRQLLLTIPAPKSLDPTSQTIADREVQDENSAPTTFDASDVPADDSYDRVVRELGYEQRAKPTDRLKTEEEQAAIAKSALEKAERARVRRMNGEADYDSEDATKHQRRQQRGRQPQGDDLDDDFVDEDDDDDVLLGSGLGDADSNRSGSSTSDRDDESSETSIKPSETDGGLPEFRDVAFLPQDQPPRRELPFTFPAPDNHDHFLDIISHFEAEDTPVVVHRLRTLYHPSLGVGNKSKLSTLLVILIEHILHLSSSDDPFPLINPLILHLNDLMKAFTAVAASTMVSKLVLMQKNLSRGLAEGPTFLEAKTFPGFAELILLRLIGSQWSTSDLWHPVVTPAMLLMGQYLSQGRVRDVKDLASGLFYQAFSCRIIPEALAFIVNAILSLAPHTFTNSTLPVNFPSPDIGLPGLRIEPDILLVAAPGKVPFDTLSPGTGGSTSDAEQRKVNLLGMSFRLVAEAANLWGSSEGFIELFDPALRILSGIKSSTLSPALLKLHASVLDNLQRRLKFARKARQPLFLQAHKPIAIKSMAPRFDPNYAGRKYGRPGADDDPEAEAKKLKAMYKMEKKAAVKELRKDNKFLAAEKARRQHEKDREYNERMAKTVGAISSERAEQKQMERMKSIAKMRAGKK